MNHHIATTNTNAQPSRPHSNLSPDMIGPHDSPGNHKAELSGQGASSVSELSPTPKRSPINTPKRAAVPASDAGSVKAERSSTAGGSATLAMQPSLDLLAGLPNNEGAEAGGRRQHVMSWMDYDGATPSPAR